MVQGGGVGLLGAESGLVIILPLGPGRQPRDTARRAGKQRDEKDGREVEVETEATKTCRVDPQMAAAAAAGERWVSMDLDPFVPLMSSGSLLGK